MSAAMPVSVAALKDSGEPPSVPSSNSPGYSSSERSLNLMFKSPEWKSAGLGVRAGAFQAAGSRVATGLGGRHRGKLCRIATAGAMSALMPLRRALVGELDLV